MINLNDMVLFAKVAELGGISAAARALSIPKSRVSRRLAILEEALGTGLLERTTRKVQLTEAGEIFYQHCKRLVEESESAVTSVTHLMASPRGLLRISVSTSIGQYLIAPYLGEFANLYPDIDLQLNINNRKVDLISEGYDLVIRVGELQDSSLMSRRMGGTRAHLCAAPSYIEKYGMPKTPEQLPDHTLLAMNDTVYMTQWVLENTAGEAKALHVDPKHGIGDFRVLQDMAQAGTGIALIPEYVIQSSLAQKNLIRILPDWRSPLINYYVLYPSRRGLTKKSEAWIDFFSAKFRDAARPQ